MAILSHTSLLDNDLGAGKKGRERARELLKKAVGLPVGDVYGGFVHERAVAELKALEGGSLPAAHLGTRPRSRPNSRVNFAMAGFPADGAAGMLSSSCSSSDSEDCRGQSRLTATRLSSSSEIADSSSSPTISRANARSGNLRPS